VFGVFGVLMIVETGVFRSNCSAFKERLLDQQQQCQRTRHLPLLLGNLQRYSVLFDVIASETERFYNFLH